MARVGAAFSAFFGILFGGRLPDGVARAFGYIKASSRRPETDKKPDAAPKPADGALQLLGLLQRDSRLVDFLMEDIAAYSDDQVGGAVRNIHTHAQEVLRKYVKLAPVIDGVEGTFSRPESAGALAGTRRPSSSSATSPPKAGPRAVRCATRDGTPSMSIFRASRPR